MDRNSSDPNLTKDSLSDDVLSSISDDENMTSVTAEDILRLTEGKDEIAREIIVREYPYVIPEDNDDNNFVLWQMMCATCGEALPAYQEQFDKWNQEDYNVTIMERIGEIVDLDNEEDFIKLTEFIMANPQRMRGVISGDLTKDTTDFIERLDNITRGEGASRETEFDVRFPVKRESWS